MTLRRIVERLEANNLSAIITIDFKKAFDSIHRGQMIRIFIAYGVPQPPESHRSNVQKYNGKSCNT
jgi:hypothetical protein